MPKRFNLPPLDLIQGFEAAARNLSFPGGRVEAAPFFWQAGRVGAAVAVWAAELRPVGGGGLGEEG